MSGHHTGAQGNMALPLHRSSSLPPADSSPPSIRQQSDDDSDQQAHRTTRQNSSVVAAGQTDQGQHPDEQIDNVLQKRGGVKTHKHISKGTPAAIEE